MGALDDRLVKVATQRTVKTSAVDACNKFAMEKEAVAPAIAAVLLALRTAGPALLRRFGPQAIKALAQRIGSKGLQTGAKMFGRAARGKIPIKPGSIVKAPKVPSAKAPTIGKPGGFLGKNKLENAMTASMLPTMFGGGGRGAGRATGRMSAPSTFKPYQMSNKAWTPEALRASLGTPQYTPPQPKF